MTSSDPQPPPLPEREDDFPLDPPRGSPSPAKSILLIVVACVVLIAVLLLVPKSGNGGRSHAPWNVKAAEAQMATFGAAIDRYRMDNKRLPSSLDALTESTSRSPYPYLDAASIPPDPWGNDYEYRVFDRRNYQIRSAGEDGVNHTEDDLLFPRRDR